MPARTSDISQRNYARFVWLKSAMRWNSGLSGCGLFEMGLKTAFIKWMLRLKVVSHLPGRLKIHVPALAHISKSNRERVEPLVNRLVLPAGVDSVEVNFSTGNLSILYDVEKISEDDVLEWLSRLKELAFDLGSRIAKVPSTRVPLVTHRLFSYLNAQIENGVAFDETLQIPRDVWT